MDYGAITTVILAAASGVVVTTKWAFGVTTKLETMKEQFQAHEKADEFYQQGVGQTMNRLETKVDRLVDHLLDKS